MAESDDAPTFVKDINHDEMRNGFLVTSGRKKLWNVEIGLINEFARICKKYNLRWFAYAGTLLGAVRHKGFIPWDDDVDVCMFRPDYEKFKQVAATEIKEPYFCDNWYEYVVETEEPLPETLDSNKQYITREYIMKDPFRWYSQWPSIRLRDNRTTMLEFPDRKTVNQGIFIDIFPLDPVPPFTDNQRNINFAVACELMIATAAPNRIIKAAQEGKKFLVHPKSLQDFLKLPYRQRGAYLENFLLNTFFESDFVGEIRDHTLTDRHRHYSAKSFEKIMHSPFEKIDVPIPIGYDELLTTDYGDWHKMIYTHNHATEYSVDIPYRQYFRQSALMR